MAKAIAIKTDDSVLRDIHIRAAKKGISIQDYITGLIERDLFPERFSDPLTQLSEEQLERLREKFDVIQDTLAEIKDILNEAPAQTQELDGMILGGIE